MDFMDDIFSEIEDSWDDQMELLGLISENLPGATLRFRTNTGTLLPEGEETVFSNELLDRAEEMAADSEEAVSCELESGRALHAERIRQLNGTLFYSFPGTFGDETGKANLAVVRLCRELFLSRMDLRDEQTHIRMQRKQLNRKLDVLKERNQEILADNQKLQQKHAQNLESEIERQTAELRDAYDSLKRYSSLQQKTLDIAATAIFTVDEENRITDINKAFSSITGYERNEALGMDAAVLETGEAESKQSFCVRESQKVMKMQCLIYRKDGTPLTVILNADNLDDESGEFISRVESFVDVTDLIRARESAEAASKAKSEFLANMSHEIRTPLNGIIGMSEMALDTDLDENQQEILSTIEMEADSLLTLINSILDFSKIEAGMLEMEKIPFDLRKLVEDISVGLGIRARQKGLVLNSFVPPEMETNLLGDPGRLRQVVVNLAGNALKFTHEGEINISVELLEQVDEAAVLKFSVRDTGVGIPENKQDTIFDKFTQVDGSTTRKYGGTGLGTTISKQLAELMGGEIGLVSKVGEGSTFWFTARFGAGRKLKTPELPPYPGVRVLVGNENRTASDVIAAYLGHMGAVAETAFDFVGVIRALEKEGEGGKSFDLLILAHELAGIDEFGALSADGTEFLIDLPVIAVNVEGREEQLARTLGIEVSASLSEPVRYAALERSVGTALGHGVAEEESESLTARDPEENARAGVSVLLVEDYPTNQMVALKHLRGAGFRVDLAENGREAVERFSLHDYHVILMDIQMPEMDGFEATRRIRELESVLAGAGVLSGTEQGVGPADSGGTSEVADADVNADVDADAGSGVGRGGGAVETQKTAGIPIIAMTAHALKGYREKCLDAAMNDYITKPLKRKKLIAMVDKWTWKAGEAGGLEAGAVSESAGAIGQPENAGVVGQPENTGTVGEPEGLSEEAIEKLFGAAPEKELPGSFDKANDEKSANWVMGETAVELPGERKAGDYESRENGGTMEVPGEAEGGAPGGEVDGENCLAAESPDKGTPPMDMARALSEFEDDKEFLDEVLDEFLSGVKGQIEILRNAVAGGDAETVRKESHSIKGGSANLTAMALSNVAADLEIIGKSGNLDSAKETLDLLEAEFVRLESYVR